MTSSDKKRKVDETQPEVPSVAQKLRTNKIVIYETVRRSENPNVLTRHERVKKALRDMRVVRIVADNDECNETLKQNSSKPLEVTMRSNEYGEVQMVIYIKGDGGFHPTKTGVDLLMDGHSLFGPAQAPNLFNDNLSNLLVGTVVGVAPSDLVALREVLREIAESDWMLRVVRLVLDEVRTFRACASDGKSADAVVKYKQLLRVANALQIAFPPAREFRWNKNDDSDSE